MTWWNPKPLRPQADNTLFTFHEQPTVVRGLSPMQRQRLADGTPPTVSGPTALRPADPALNIRPSLVKSSMVEKIEEENPRYGVPRRDPVEPLGVIKSYMAYKSKDEEDPDEDSEKEMQEVNKASEHRDPEGGLTAAGRKHFNKKEGSNLKPGVKGKDSDLSDTEKKRKGSFLTRHYKGEHNAKKPLKDEKGEPTRHALQAQAWGEKTPKTPADRAKLVKDGERLLAQVNKSIERAKHGWDDEALSKAELTSAKREKLKERSFALPDERKYPIHDESHARNALARVAQHGTPEEQKQVRNAVARRYKNIEVTKPDDRDDEDDDKKVEKAALDRMFSSINSLTKACGGSYMAKADSDEDDAIEEEDDNDSDLEKAAKYTKPDLRDRIKKEVMAGSDGGKPGQWSARKAQLVAQKYKAAGGGYKGDRSKEQSSLSKWTKEEWTTSDGKPADRPGGMRRYLPKEAWDKLSAGEKEATNLKKKEGSKKGQQFVANTDAAKEARDKAQDKKVEKAALSEMFSSINKLTKACGGSYMVKSDDDEDDREEAEESMEAEESEEKALTPSAPNTAPKPKAPPKPNATPKPKTASTGSSSAARAGSRLGSSVVSAAASPIRSVLGAAKPR